MKVEKRKSGYAVIDDRTGKQLGLYATQWAADAQAAMFDLRARRSDVDRAKEAADASTKTDAAIKAKRYDKLDPERAYELGRQHALEDAHYETTYSPMWDQAEELYNQGKFTQAALAFDKAHSKMPDAAAAFRAADAWARAGATKQANEGFMRALQLHQKQGGLAPESVKYANDQAFETVRNEAEPLPAPQPQQGAVRPNEQPPVVAAMPTGGYQK